MLLLVSDCVFASAPAAVPRESGFSGELRLLSWFACPGQASPNWGLCRYWADLWFLLGGDRKKPIQNIWNEFEFFALRW
jgi:hypothetical protein